MSQPRPSKRTCPQVQKVMDLLQALEAANDLPRQESKDSSNDEEQQP